MKFKNIIAERKNKIIYRDGEYCVKLFNSDFSKIDVLNEALNQARIEETGLNIPKIKEVSMIDGQWAIIYEYIEGKTLAECMEENPEKLDEYLEFFVDLQLQVLNSSCPLLNRLKEKMHRKIDQTELSSFVKYELHTRLDGMPKKEKVCHGDFNPTNIILGSDGKTYIIDWLHVTQGNASADAARTYLLFKLAKKDEVAEKYLDLFCEKGNIIKQLVQKWMPIVAASQSVKGNEDEKQILLSWANVVDL